MQPLSNWRLAEAQAAIANVLKTLEQVLQERAELRHKQEQAELAKADLRQVLALAREISTNHSAAV
jgi:hypothetical protein